MRRTFSALGEKLTLCSRLAAARCGEELLELLEPATLAVESQALLLKLDRGHVVVDSDLQHIMRMRPTVRYKTDTGETRTITLVFPDEADIFAGKVSVLRPHRDRATGSFGWAVSFLDRP